jgi:hypothetical protein
LKWIRQWWCFACALRLLCTGGPALARECGFGSGGAAFSGLGGFLGGGATCTGGGGLFARGYGWLADER